MNNNSSTRYYEKTKTTKRVCDRFPKRKKGKSVNMILKDIKIFLNMKGKGLLSIEKIVLKCKKVSCNNFSNHL